MAKIYKQPFAHSGDAIAIPSSSQPDGKMSSADGWTPDYQLLKTDPNYKPVGRQEMNGVFKEVTEALGQVQVQGAASWSADGAPYPINAQVYHNGNQWIALRANGVEPTEGADWTEFSAAAINNKIDKSVVVQSTGTSTTDIMSQKAVSDALKDQIDFTIIYPNGGSEASPAMLAASSRYITENPFPGYSVICELEVLIDDEWNQFSTTGTSVSTHGAWARQHNGGSIVVGTLRQATGIVSDPVTTGGTAVAIAWTDARIGGARVKVWKIKGLAA